MCVSLIQNIFHRRKAGVQGCADSREIEYKENVAL